MHLHAIPTNITESVSLAPKLMLSNSGFSHECVMHFIGVFISVFIIVISLYYYCFFFCPVLNKPINKQTERAATCKKKALDCFYAYTPQHL